MLNSRSPLNARSLPIQEVREPLLSALGRQWRVAPNTTKDSGRRLGRLPIPFGRPLRVIQEFARQQVLRFPDLSDFARIGVSPATSLHVNSTRITERVFARVEQEFVRIQAFFANNLRTTNTPDARAGIERTKS
jgi:hypothetical protein